MPTSTGNFSPLLAPGLRKIFFDAYRHKEMQYERYFTTIPTSRAYEEDHEVVGLGTMPQKDEGDSTIYTDPKDGATKRFTMVSFGLGFRVTTEMWEDDLYGVMRKMPKQLGKAARIAKEVRAHNVLNNAFTSQSGFTKNGNTEFLISTSHTLLGTGGTQANRASTDADLGYGALEAAYQSFAGLVDEQGYPITVMPRILLVPPLLEQIAYELTASEYRPDNANNAKNFLYGKVTPMVCNYLTDTDSWFLLADKGDDDGNGLMFFERAAVRFQNGDDFDSGDAKFKAFMRFEVGASEYRGMYGSLGA